MKPFIFSFVLIVFCCIAQAHTVEQYVTTKDGVTLFALISWGSDEERKIQDAFLDRLVQKLNRQDKSIPIYLCVISSD